MYRTALTLVIVFATVLAGCEQANDIIPGEGELTPEATAPPSNPTPIVSRPQLDTGTDTPTPTPSIPDHELARSVVQIQVIDTTTGDVRSVRDGSGVIIDREAGLILTAYPIVRPHLSSGARAYTTIAVGVNDGTGGSPRLEYEADLIAADNLLGLAVLRVTRAYEGEVLAPDGFAFPAAEPGDASRIEPGDTLRLFGHPGLEIIGVDSQALRVAEGTVTGRRGEPDRAGTTRLKVDAQLPYGSTGGPAFDRNGTLIGLLVPEHYNLEAPVTQIRPFNLAAPLIAAARGLPSNVEFVAPLHADEPPAGFTAPTRGDGVWVSRPLFAEDATTNGNSLDLFDYERGFVSGTQELFFEFAIQGAEPGALVEERWYLNGVLQDSLSSSYPWDGNGFALVADRISVPAPAVLANGRWRLEIWIDDLLRASSTAVIGIELDSPIMFNPTFGALAGASGQSISEATSSAEQILLFFDYAGMEITGGFRWVVLRDGELMYQSSDLQWPGAGAGRFWVGYAGDGPIGPGNWSFQILVDGEQTLEAFWEVF